MNDKWPTRSVPATRWLTKAEAADYLGCSLHTIDQLMAEGKLKARRVTDGAPRGTRPRLDTAELDRHMLRKAR